MPAPTTSTAATSAQRAVDEGARLARRASLRRRALLAASASPFLALFALPGVVIGAASVAFLVVHRGQHEDAPTALALAALGAAFAVAFFAVRTVRRRAERALAALTPED